MFDDWSQIAQPIEPAARGTERTGSKFDFTELKRFLAVMLGIVAIVTGGFVVADMLEPTPEELLVDEVAQRLSSEPNAEDLTWLLHHAEHVEAAQSQLDTDREAAWKTWIAQSWSDLLTEDLGVFCNRAAVIADIGWADAGGQRVRVACESYANAREALDEVERQNEDKLVDYRRAERKVAAAQDKVDEARRRVAVARDGMAHFSGYLRQQIEPQVYEVNEGGQYGDFYILKTQDTTFTTTGMVQLWVRRAGSTTVTTRSGQIVERTILVEADMTVVNIANAVARDAASDLADARSALRAVPRPNTAHTGPYETRLASAAAKVRRVAEGAGPLPPWTSPQRVTDAGEQLEYLSLVCADASTDSDGVAVCETCPKGSKGEDDDMKVVTAYRGAFSATDRHEVFLALSGCGGGRNFRHSTALLRFDEAQGWQLIAHDWKVATDSCQPEVLDGKQVLLCSDSTMGGGSVHTHVTIVSVEGDEPTLTVVAELEDHSGGCTYDGEFGATIEERFVEDVDGDGTTEAVVLVTVQTGTYRLGAQRDPNSDGCGDLEAGLVSVKTTRRAHARALTDAEPMTFNAPDSKIASERVRNFLAALADPLPDVRAEVDRLLQFEPDSESAWLIYRRRIDAYRNARQLGSLERQLPRLAELFPQHATDLSLELAEACEEAEDYGCASGIYDLILIDEAAPASAQGRAAWFFATAPPPFRQIDKAGGVVVALTNADALDVRAAMAQAEIYLQQDNVDAARTFLEEFRKTRKSQLIDEQLARIADNPAPLDRPRDVIPALNHKVPPEWEFAVPEGELSPEEGLFVVEFEAIKERRKRRFDRAEAIYREALRRASNIHLRNTLHLGIGKVFEDARNYDRALAHYDKMLRSESERDPRIINRLAWFLLTVDSTEHRDVERGTKLAERAAEATNRTYPAVLDTLAEAFIRAGDIEQARALLRECIELDPTRDYYQQRLAEL